MKKESNTTPIRVVYDCSAKVSSKSLSLNDCLYTGPSLVPDLAQVLLRFRCQKYVFILDIEKAFLMVQLHENDRDYTRFLWPKDPSDPESDFLIYRFRVVLFGATCSQFLLNATIRHHLNNLDEANEMIDDIKRGLYIDNLQGTANQEDLLAYYWQVQKLFKKANLYLREWNTNSPRLEQQLHLDGVIAGEKGPVKILGLYWEPKSDSLSFNLRTEIQGRVTKRKCLSMVSQLFDPLGLLLPVTIKARIFLQNLWKAKLDWDQPLPEVMNTEWEGHTAELHKASKITVPRVLYLIQEGDMHVFGDASNMAYGACVYIVNGSGNLVIGKAKVAPIKAVTIPKLELTAVLLPARLSKFVKDAYDGVILFKNIHLLCDSQVALHWIQSKKILPAYVIIE